MCRFTHVYPDGPAPYFTVLAPARRGSELEQWDEIKAAASEAIIAGGRHDHPPPRGRARPPALVRPPAPGPLRGRAAGGQGGARPGRRPEPGRADRPVSSRQSAVGGALSFGAMSILGEPGERDELHRLQANELYLPRKDTREAVKTLGRGALACPSCDVPVVTAEPIGIIGPPALPVLPASSTRPAASCGSTSRDTALNDVRVTARMRRLTGQTASAEPTHLVAWPTVQGSTEMTPRRGRPAGGRVARPRCGAGASAGVIPDYRGPLDPRGRRARAHRRAPARAGPLAGGDQGGGRGRPACVRLRRRAVPARRGDVRPRAGGRSETGLEPALIERLWRAMGFPPGCWTTSTRRTSRRCATWRRCWRPASRWSRSSR